jgi:hypothetical protein
MLALAIFATLSGLAAAQVSTPKQILGHDLGEDYWLPNYSEFTKFLQTLDEQSDRLKVVSIGKSEEGRDQLMGIITAPENHKNLALYQSIAKRMAQAEGLSKEAAETLAGQGKAVVWIDGGLHATEVLGPTQLMETLYQFVSMDDAETTRILNDVIILFVHANPDGMDLVADWYMREPDKTKREYFTIPRLYQKYIGHDNNRDFYASTQSESKNMNRTMYREWFPQIMYNHHQTGPAGTVMFVPPFRDPFNHHYDPMIITGIDVVGSAMQNRFAQEGKGGFTSRTGASYSTWWNGGLRTTAYFHNIIGILTETIGSPTPMAIPLVPNRLEPKTEQPFPIEPQPWHFRQSVDYSVSANRAILDLASRYRERFLLNIWQMGTNSIARGSKDNWTHYPKHIEAVSAAVQNKEKEPLSKLKDTTLRDARAYILPASQLDFPTATKFINALIENGVIVHQATSDFSAGGKTYPKGSYVVRTAQAFRPHILDMFEPQNHPNDFRVPGGAPTPPYDNAGWTLAYQMGIEFDRILEGFEAPLEPVADIITRYDLQVASGASGWVLDPRVNASHEAANRLASQAQVSRSPIPLAGIPAGGFFVRAGPGTQQRLQDLARDLGIKPTPVQVLPKIAMQQVRPTSIGLWDSYGGSMPSGWTRWLFEQFEFPHKLVFAKELDSGKLDHFKTLVFVDGAIPERSGGSRSQLDESRVPEEFKHMLGSVSADKTVPKLKEFMEAGGTIVAIGSSTSIAKHLGLPIRDHLTEMDKGELKPLPREKYYIPGSLLRVKVDTTLPVAYGMPEYVDVMFDNSPVFDLTPEAIQAGAKPIMWFDSAEPLRSGWAWGQSYLKDGVAAVEYPIGKGKLFLFGPEIAFRAQPHGTFKLLFNAVRSSNAP